jgi:predicted alpha/beta hydrolase family esterase
MKPRIIYIHGNGSSHWSFAWAKWLKSELDELGYETFFETFPDSIIAREEHWLPFLKEHVKAGENDVIVGWSTGAVAAMRYAEENKIKGSVLVAPSYTDLGDEMEIQSGYFDRPWDWQKIKSNQEHILLVHGDNDPYIPRSEFDYIATQLVPERLIISDNHHFIERNEFPELLDYLKRVY